MVPKTKTPSNPYSIAEDWTHEGPEDPASDTQSLKEGLGELLEFPSADRWTGWGDFESHLDEVEEADVLPD